MSGQLNAHFVPDLFFPSFVQSKRHNNLSAQVRCGTLLGAYSHTTTKALHREASISNGKATAICSRALQTLMLHDSEVKQFTYVEKKAAHFGIFGIAPHFFTLMKERIKK